eukprot:Awhi_evm1s3422
MFVLALAISSFAMPVISQCTTELTACPAESSLAINADTCEYECDNGTWDSSTCSCVCRDTRVWCPDPLTGSCSFYKALDANTATWWCPGDTDHIETCGDGVCAGWETEGCNRCVADCGICAVDEKPDLVIEVRRYAVPAEIVIKVRAYITYYKGEWTQSFELPLEYTIDNLWGANYTRNGTTVTLTGLPNQALYLYSEGRGGAAISYDPAAVDPLGDNPLGFVAETPLTTTTESTPEVTSNPDDSDASVNNQDNSSLTTSPVFFL